MSLDLLKAARDAQAALVDNAKARALDAHRTADDADKVADGHVGVLKQLDAALESFTEQAAASISKAVIAEAVEQVRAHFDELLK